MADEFEFSNFVPGLTEVVDNLTTAAAALALDKNETIEFQDEGVPIATKGGIQYVNFTGAGVSSAEGSPGILDVTIPGGGAGSGLSQPQVLARAFAKC